MRCGRRRAIATGSFREALSPGRGAVVISATLGTSLQAGQVPSSSSFFPQVACLNTRLLVWTWCPPQTSSA